ncbi:MAG: hypothetical protein R3B72_50295 [Polyangiaceae bacterium]
MRNDEGLTLGLGGMMLMLAACGGETEPMNEGGGGSAPAVEEQASISLTGAQTESWSFNGEDNHFFCAVSEDSLDVVIGREPLSEVDQVFIKLEPGTYSGDGDYMWATMSGNFSQQVIVKVGTSFSYETEVLGGAMPSCSLTTSSTVSTLEGHLVCSDLPSSTGSADTPPNVNDPRPKLGVDMTFTCGKS